MCFQHRQLAISGCWTLRTSQVSLSGPVVFCGHCCDITVWSRLWMNNQVQSLTRPTNPNAHHVSLLRSKLFQQPCKCFPCYRTRCYKACIHRPRYSHRNRKNAEQYHVYHIRTFDVSKSNPRSASSAAQPTTPVARWAKNQTSVYPKPPKNQQLASVPYPNLIDQNLKTRRRQPLSIWSNRSTHSAHTCCKNLTRAPPPSGMLVWSQASWKAAAWLHNKLKDHLSSKGCKLQVPNVAWSKFAFWTSHTHTHGMKTKPHGHKYVPSVYWCFQRGTKVVAKNAYIQTTADPYANKNTFKGT